MPDWVNMILTLLTGIFASSGFWSYWTARHKSNTAERRLLIGLAHDRIIYLGIKYIERGYITQDEYENLNDYLYEPYEKAGGNGSAKRVMQTVRQLPLHPNN